MKIQFNDNVYRCRSDESLLEMFLRNGVSVPFSCRNGVCHACLMRTTVPDLPSLSQKNLKQSLVEKGYFKLCKCYPNGDMDVHEPRVSDLVTRAIVYQKELLSPDVCRILLEPLTQIYYKAGQFINIVKDDGVTRSYSLASAPCDDYYLELHVKHLRGGEMSSWIFSELTEGEEIEFQGPLGNCYYRSEYTNEDLLLISTGTGLAPHIGIAKQALLSGHTGEIKIYHGARKYHGHYLWPELQKLSEQYSNFNYTMCASQEKGSESAVSGRANDIALEHTIDISSWTVYLSGHPDMVSDTKSRLISAGLSEDKIHDDAFVYSDCTNNSPLPEELKSTCPVFKERRKYPDPDPEMWLALGHGVLMNRILDDFYTRVYADDLLSSYFKNVTRQRLVEKAYNFHYQMFTGEKVYFGERPRNAHHWMVISDEIFDYREKLMETCLRDHDLPEHLIKRWLAYDEMYREDIVKSSPVGKILFGVELPVDGFEEIVITASTLCDSCHGEIKAGEKVRYHVRLGTTYCPKCMQSMPM